MFKRFNDFIINERFHEELNNDIERYIFYTKDFDENEMKKIYKILFNKGYKFGDVNDIKDLGEEYLHISFMIIGVYSKYILYSTNPNIENNINSIAYYLTRIGMGNYEYYFIKDKKDFDNIFNVLSINAYFNSRNVYESLLDKMKGLSNKEILNNLKDLSPKELLSKSANIGFLLGVETAIKTGEITQKEKDISLIDASSHGYYDIVELLLKNGADPVYLDNRAFMLAGSNGHKDVTGLLIKYKNKGLKESLLNNNSDYFKPNINVYESILNKLEGPSQEEIFNLFGFDKYYQFNDFIEHIINISEIVDSENNSKEYKIKLKNKTIILLTIWDYKKQIEISDDFLNLLHKLYDIPLYPHVIDKITNKVGGVLNKQNYLIFCEN